MPTPQKNELQQQSRVVAGDGNNQRQNVMVARWNETRMFVGYPSATPNAGRWWYNGVGRRTASGTGWI